MKRYRRLVFNFGYLPSQNEIIEFAEKILKNPHRERFVLYFVKNLTLDEIAKIENVSKSVISRSIDSSLTVARWYVETTNRIKS